MQYSIVTFNSVKDEIHFRLDADYYKPKYLLDDSLISKYPTKTLGSVAFITDGQHGYHEVDPKSKILHLTAKNAKHWFADDIDADPLAEWVHLKNQRSSLQTGDLILSTRGSVGYCAIVTPEILPANIDQDVARISLDTDDFVSEFVLTYVNCIFGQDWITRNLSGMIQQGLPLKKVGEFPVPFLHKNFQNIIQKLVLQAYESRQTSEINLIQAENLLLTELGLLNWQSKHQLSFVRQFSETQDAERMDAEYFQPKYEELVENLHSYPHGWDILKNMVRIKDKNFNPLPDEIYQYIELSNIGVQGEVTGAMAEYGSDLPTRARRKVSTGDVIVSSIEGSLESIALVDEPYNNALCSTGFYVINSKKLNSATLLIFLKSIAGQMQLKKGCNGTILTAINKDEFRKIVIPTIQVSVQEQIAEMVYSASQMRRNALALLESAKRAVEMAIEKDEETAIHWLEKQVAL